MNQSSLQNKRSAGQSLGRRFGISRAAIALPLMISGIAAVPATALAAAPNQTVKQSTFKYNVPVNRMALAKGTHVVANGTVISPQSNVRDWWSADTVNRVVRAGVNNDRQSPYSKDGFKCTPTINGERTNFVCKLRGADVPTSITLRYSLIYRGDTASG